MPRRAISPFFRSRGENLTLQNKLSRCLHYGIPLLPAAVL